MKPQIDFLGGFDFSDILPLFSDPVSINPNEREPYYNFGLGDIINIPGLDEILVECAGRLQEFAPRLVGVLPGMQGNRPLCDRLASLIQSETGLTTSGNDILVTDGGCDGIAIAAMAICSQDRGIAYAVPAFPYWCVLHGTGIAQYPMLLSSPVEYQKEFGQRLIELIDMHPTIKAIILNEPQNPMGLPLADDQLKLLGDYTCNNNIYIILDDVGRGLCDMSSKWWGSFFDPEKVIVVDSFTKRYACPGLRLGFVRVPTGLLKIFRGFVANFRGGVSNLSTQFGLLLIELLEKYDKIGIVKSEVKRRLYDLHQNISYIKSAYVQTISPPWGLYALLDVTKFHMDTAITGKNLVRILRKQGIHLMDNSFLFPPDLLDSSSENLIRFSIGGEIRIEAGLEFLAHSIESIVADNIRG